MDRDRIFDNYELAMRLQAVREATKKTQQEVADDLGIDRNQIKVWECGTRQIKAKDLFMLSKYYGVSADYLLGLSDVSSLDIDLQAVCKYTGLSEDAIDNIEYGYRHGFEAHSMANMLLTDFFDVLGEMHINLRVASKCLQLADNNPTQNIDDEKPFSGADWEIDSMVLALMQDMDCQPDPLHKAPDIPKGTMLLSARDASDFYIDKIVKIFRDLVEQAVKAYSACKIMELENGEEL